MKKLSVQIEQMEITHQRLHTYYYAQLEVSFNCPNAGNRALGYGADSAERGARRLRAVALASTSERFDWAISMPFQI